LILYRTMVMNPKNCPDNREGSVPICSNCSPVSGDSQFFFKDLLRPGFRRVYETGLSFYFFIIIFQETWARF